MSRLTISILAAAAVLCGGMAAAVIALLGSSEGSATTIQQPPLTAVADTGPSTRTVTVTKPAPAARPPSLDFALSEVDSEGFRVFDPSTYNPGQSVAVLVGMYPGGDGTRQQAFFFADGRYLGTDTSEPSAGIDVAYQSASIVALRYALYDASDPQCCPTDGSATVRYKWTGQELVPLDPIPPDSFSVSGSRR